MQRMAWSDERLEERFDGIDRRFDEVDRRLDEADERNRERFEGVNRRIDGVDKRIDGVEVQLGEIRQSIIGLHTTFSRGSLAIVATLLGVIAAILVKAPNRPVDPGRYGVKTIFSASRRSNIA